MRNVLHFLILLCFPLFSNSQDRLLKVSSNDSINGEPRIEAWFGANMKLNGYYNISGGLQEFDTFNIGYIDVYGNDNRHNLGIDLYQTQIRLNASYIHPKIGKITAHVEWDFWGGNGAMRLRKAYVMTDHWQIGQDWDNFGNQNVWPNVLDFDGPPSGIWARTPFIKYFNTFAEDKWQYEIAVQGPMINYEEFPNLKNSFEYTYQNTPDGVLAIKRQGKWGHLRLSTVFRDINYLENGKQKSLFGYGASLSGIYGDFGRTNFQFQYAIGKGISAYMASFGGSGYDAYPGSESFQATPSQGIWTAAEYYLTDDIHFNLVYGFTQFYFNDIVTFTFTDDIAGNDFVVSDGNVNIYHNYFLTNVMWDPIPNFTIGIEFDYGIKSVSSNGIVSELREGTPFDDKQRRSASRISFGFMYNF